MSAKRSIPQTTSEGPTAKRPKVNTTKKPSALAPSAVQPGVIERAVDKPAVAESSEILTLQRKYGNQAVQRLLASRSVQAKLTVGPASDRYEQEADQMADQVMKMPIAPQGAQDQPSVQRQAEEEEIQTKPLASSISPLLQRQPEEEEVQTKRQDPREGFEAGSTIEDQLNAQKGGGSPLSGDVRAAMEPRFGTDFSGVRIHADSQADHLNRQLSAQAFTHGQDIYVGAGQYQPGTESGQHLLAHELTHVVQQTGQIQRLSTRADLIAQAGVPHSDINLGLFKYKKSSGYKTVLAALETYHNYLRGRPTTEPGTLSFWDEAATKVEAKLDELKDILQEYVDGHPDDTKRTPFIQAIINTEIPEERRLLSVIKSHGASYLKMNFEQALVKARVGEIAARAAEMTAKQAEAGKKEGVKLGIMEELKKSRKDLTGKALEQEAESQAEPIAEDLTGEELKQRTMKAFGEQMDAGATKAQDFRSNSAATKLGTAMNEELTRGYFQAAVVPAFTSAMFTSDALVEIDPTKIKGTEEKAKRQAVKDNAVRLEKIYREVMRVFSTEGVSKVPLPFAQYCAQLYALAAGKMKKEEAYLFTSSQVFLRSINPMVTNLYMAIPDGQKGKRAMLLLSKLIQNDANKVAHGAQKEPYMSVLGSITEYQTKLAEFIQAVVEKGK